MALTEQDARNSDEEYEGETDEGDDYEEAPNPVAQEPEFGEGANASAEVVDDAEGDAEEDGGEDEDEDEDEDEFDEEGVEEEYSDEEDDEEDEEDEDADEQPNHQQILANFYKDKDEDVERSESEEDDEYEIDEDEVKVVEEKKVQVPLAVPGEKRKADTSVEDVGVTDKKAKAA
ncbi:hypothetical protein M231_06586 [Tremella mesenterica]|uniref:Uncharacterized protein n=1 Tax=Tremella mesenterica TaxID=5217 RepID=A0A4Q1BDZ2_TREME|nr:hypothetical protein M231_06586 [Tremella mesenterica]